MVQVFLFDWLPATEHLVHCFSLMVLVAIFCPGPKGSGHFFIVPCPTFDMVPWKFFKIFRGWGVRGQEFGA
jgi:hypothetical protein